MKLTCKFFLALFFFSFILSAQTQYFPYRDNDSWGFCNEKAEIIEPPIYDSVERNWDSYDAFYIVAKENKKGVYFNSKLIIPAIFDNVKILFKNIIIVENQTDKGIVSQIYNSDGNLLIHKKIKSYSTYFGYNYQFSNFVVGFNIKSVDNKFSIVSIGFNDNNKVTFLVEDAFSLEIDKKKSKGSLEVYTIKKTEKSNEEIIYLKKSEEIISLLQINSDKELFKLYTNETYDSNTEVVEEIPFDVIRKSNIYRDYEINQNKIEIKYKNQSRYVKENKKQEIINFPFKATFKTQNLEYSGKEIISKDTTYLYPKAIVFYTKKKMGFFYKYPFQKGMLFDTILYMKSVKKYHNVGKNFFKVGVFDKKNKVMNYGVVDLDQKVVLPIHFQEIELGYNFMSYNTPNVFLVKKNNKFGLVSELNQEILPFEFDFISKVNSNETFLLLEKNQKHSAFIKYYNGKERITEILPSYFQYKIKQVVFKNSPKKFYPKNLVEAIDYLVLEDENGNVKGYANPNGTLYFKD